MRSKVTEGKTNLHAIRVAELSYLTSGSTFLPALASPVADAAVGPRKQPWVDNGGFDQLGWEPEGQPYFNYKVAVLPGGCPGPGNPCTSFTAEAGSDLDGDAVLNYWGYVHPDAAGVAPNAVSCASSGVFDPQSGAQDGLKRVGPCGANMGVAIF
jgi:hypothetical protein